MSTCDLQVAHRVDAGCWTLHYTLDTPLQAGHRSGQYAGHCTLDYTLQWVTLTLIVTFNICRRLVASFLAANIRRNTPGQFTMRKVSVHVLRLGGIPAIPRAGTMPLIYHHNVYITSWWTTTAEQRVMIKPITSRPAHQYPCY